MSIYIIFLIFVAFMRGLQIIKSGFEKKDFWQKPFIFGLCYYYIFDKKIGEM